MQTFTAGTPCSGIVTAYVTDADSGKLGSVGGGKYCCPDHIFQRMPKNAPTEVCTNSSTSMSLKIGRRFGEYQFCNSRPKKNAYGCKHCNVTPKKGHICTNPPESSKAKRKKTASLPVDAGYMEMPHMPPLDTVSHIPQLRTMSSRSANIEDAEATDIPPLRTMSHRSPNVEDVEVADIPPLHTMPRSTPQRDNCQRRSCILEISKIVIRQKSQIKRSTNKRRVSQSSYASAENSDDYTSSESESDVDAQFSTSLTEDKNTNTSIESDPNMTQYQSMLF
jgi:hypothetical protein